MLSTTFWKTMPRREAPCPGESARAQHWVGGWGMDPVLVRGFVKFLLLGVVPAPNPMLLSRACDRFRRLAPRHHQTKKKAIADIGMGTGLIYDKVSTCELPCCDRERTFRCQHMSVFFIAGCRVPMIPTVKPSLNWPDVPRRF